MHFKARIYREVFSKSGREIIPDKKAIIVEGEDRRPPRYLVFDVLVEDGTLYDELICSTRELKTLRVKYKLSGTNQYGECIYYPMISAQYPRARGDL